MESSSFRRRFTSTTDAANYGSIPVIGEPNDWKLDCDCSAFFGAGVTE
jgi:hypothetical protein